jgi:hypothetical protein
LHNSHYIFIRHVHGFLEEIGQGVQHVASRVDDIISFVQEANDRRKVFGEVSPLPLLEYATRRSIGQKEYCSTMFCILL